MKIETKNKYQNLTKGRELVCKVVSGTLSEPFHTVLKENRYLTKIGELKIIYSLRHKGGCLRCQRKDGSSPRMNTPLLN